MKRANEHFDSPPPKKRRRKSRWIGVSWSKEQHKWIAMREANGVRKTGGYFSDEEENFWFSLEL